MLPGVVVSSPHLSIQMVLYKVPEVQLFLNGLVQFLWPFREGGGTKFVAIIAELCIRLQPLLVFLEEFLVRGSAADGRPFLSKQHLQILCLGIDHAFVVNLRQSVQFLT